MRQSHYLYVDDTDAASHLILKGEPVKCVVQLGDVRLIFSNLDQLVKFAAAVHEAGNAFAEATPAPAQPLHGSATERLANSYAELGVTYPPLAAAFKAEADAKEPSFVTEDRSGKLHFDDAADALYRAGKCIYEFTRDERSGESLTDAEAISAAPGKIIGKVLVRRFPHPEGWVRYMLFRVEGEQSLPPSPTGSAVSTEPTLPNGMPAVPHSCGECGVEILTGLYCQPCVEKLYKEVPF